MLAASLPLFGDEAFYWLESRHPAWGYSDLPGLTAWLIRAGTEAGGMTALAVRAPFLALGALLPWLVIGLARPRFGARVAWQAGLLALALPLAGSLGILALPDVPLTAAVLLAVLAVDRAADGAGARWWAALALALGLAAASHYRGVMLALALGLFAVATPRGRALWRRPGWYAALAGGAIGSLPTLVSNLRSDWAGLAFQALERNPWALQPRALAQPLLQALVATPLLYLLVLGALVLALRRWRRGAPWDLLAASGLVFIGGYFVLGLFADNERFNVHWPLPGLLVLLPGVALLGRRLWQARRGRRLLRPALLLTWIGVGAAQAGLLLFLLGVAVPALDGGWSASRSGARVFAGWAAAGAEVRRLHAARPELPVVADNFRLGAELGFALDARVPVHVLDSPLNRKHGRAVQLRAWGLDEPGLFAAHGGRDVLLVVEETALRERQQPAWLGGLCTRVREIRPLARVDAGPHTRIAFYRARLRAAPLAAPPPRDACRIWREAWRARQARAAQGTASPQTRSMRARAMRGSPTSALGSCVSMASKRLMPSPSQRKLPAQSSGVSRAT